MKTFLMPLDAEEEKYYLALLEQGDCNAREILIERNMRLVAHIAKKYQNAEEDMEELISIGTIGLIKAVNTYNGKKGNRIGTYAARCIENELLMYFRGRKKVSREVSLYEPIGTDKEGNQIKLMDVVESDAPELPEAVELRKNVAKLYQLVPDILSERERYIICRRYGLYNCRPLTQREISEVLGISRSYVSRIEKKALEKLKAELSK
ncbi:RNA polymerase sigma-28 factor precursor [uncultured Roseburia sp.]|uniref:RNA polymerase sigma factor n=1 Tax=Brotonthovivens ammoniilytica TaxID=2981725 RepID=A0ABT2TH06_9FIRM|nr:RNA polymerase sporulation sigma factor SigK [Brotonthovivens ammoniilytica]MCU6761479.1 RNA polymerase sporulation sigma factor SigK [Brotonthovivens ammoniilytica]SCI29666.1 RNA polymerase sigma-28 factor precursor [uncultured Roseburia sp.]